MLCDKKVCCGCSLCAVKCPTQAIKMVEDEEGFRYPYIEEEKCIHCGKCTKICPGLKENVIDFKVESHFKERAFAGYRLNREMLLKSSSGGVAYVISEAIIKKGGVVFGVRYNEDYKGASYILVKNIEQLPLLAESKYVESDRSVLFNNIEEQIETGKPVLVVGLPCDIAAVRSLIGEPDNLYTCKLICRSTTSNRVLRDFLERYEQEYGSMVNKISLRYKEKDRPVFPTKIRIDFTDDQVVVDDFTKSDYGKAFQILARTSCLQCNYKGITPLADLTLGDFQGMRGDEEYYNLNGVSLICEHTEKGKELLHSLEEVYLKEVPYEEIVRYNWMMHTAIPESPFRKKFSEDFKTSGLSKACSLLRKDQNEALDKIVKEFVTGEKSVGVWGVGDTTDYLYERLEMHKWNIISYFDRSLMKVGKKYKGKSIHHIDDIVNWKNKIDVLVVMIPSENEVLLNSFLQRLGWEKKILHVGKYKFFKG